MSLKSTAEELRSLASEMRQERSNVDWENRAENLFKQAAEIESYEQDDE